MHSAIVYSNNKCDTLVNTIHTLMQPGTYIHMTNQTS